MYRPFGRRRSAPLTPVRKKDFHRKKKILARTRPGKHREAGLLRATFFEKTEKQNMRAGVMGVANSPLPERTVRLSYGGERVFDRKAASSTIGAHICLFLWHVEHLSVKCRRDYHVGAIAVPF